MPPKRLLPALLAIFLLALSGCGPHIDYAKFDPRCKDWNGTNSHGRYDANFAAADPDVETYYEYFACLYSTSSKIASELKFAYFAKHASEFLAIAPTKLARTRSDVETLALSQILAFIQLSRSAQVASNQEVMQAWGKALDSIKSYHFQRLAYKAYFQVR
ncbi:hypothetical protein [Fundidesulfovibrio soli]|uniref:hypothetical protein n=1 Tax=Fundidesulfovibrio soli TaxID=2922716 RepID=UPI001FAF96CA|nr:hypothetical protein [Fundidesulfovibrio soli]